MADCLIRLRDVDVSYYINAEGVNSIKQYLLNFGRNKLFVKKRILTGLNLEINKGETVGFLGRNGSGKSTLLRLISGVIPPENGELEVKGTIAPMIALGVGLEPDMTGYENIKLTCSLMGYSKKETKLYLNGIKEFSELSDDSLKMQVKRYSSGMKSRLAFSITTAKQPEILIVDEALAVGDVAFVEKCKNRIHNFKAQGTTILFVSHSLEQVKSICERAVLLDSGKLVMDGTVDEVGKVYNKLLVS